MGGGSETMIVEKDLQFAEAYQHHGYRMADVANTQTAGANTSVRGDTSFIVENDVLRLDDFSEDEDGICWGYICKECVEKYGISGTLLENDCSGGTCGVQGCGNEADYCMDFKKSAGREEKDGVWAVALDVLRGGGRPCTEYAD